MPEWLTVPAWIRKDHELYTEVRRRTFQDQADLNEYLSRLATRRKLKKGRNRRYSRDERKLFAV